jgi:hypothetical protein
MSLTYETAIDEIFARFNQVWETETPIVTGDAPEIRWQGIEEPKKPPFGKYWTRVSQETVFEEQITLRDPTCGQRHRTTGLLFIQIFCPRSDARAMENGRKLAVIARNAYRAYKTLGGAWFRNSRILELEAEPEWIRFNVVVEYEYDETV